MIIYEYLLETQYTNFQINSNDRCHPTIYLKRTYFQSWQNENTRFAFQTSMKLGRINDLIEVSH